LFIRCYNATYDPGARTRHSASLVKNRIYVAGGIKGVATLLNDTFYIDSSLDFTFDNPPFINDTTTSDLKVSFVNMTSFVGAKDNTTIFLFGGWKGVSLIFTYYNS